MNHKTQNIIYTKADIERYLQGKMNFTEMHQFELAALDDAFLSDAIDGFMQAKATESQKNISEVETKILVSQHTTKIVDLKSNRKLDYFKIAASIFAVCLISFFAYKFVSVDDSKEVQKEIAENIQAKNKPASASNLTQSKDTQNIVVQSPKPTMNEFVASANNSGENSNNNSQQTKEIRQNSSDNYQNLDVNISNEQQPIIKTDDVAIKLDSTSKNSLLNNNSVNNAVTYSNNDIAKFSKPRSGYSNESAMSNNINLATIKLKTDSSFKPVAYTNITSAKAKKEIVSNTYKLTKEDSLAVPENGWAAFNEYVKNNTSSILITDTTKRVVAFKDAKTGEDVVDLEFFIDKDGKPSQITVAHSTNPNNDTTAISLLKNGPKWIETTDSNDNKKKNEKNKEKKKAKVSIKINQ